MPARHRAPGRRSSPEAAIDRGRGAADGSNTLADEFRHTVVDELYKQLFGVLTSSLWRVMPRYLAERNQAILDQETKLGRSVKPGDVEARAANVLVSHPMDRLVVDALCSGIVEFDVDGYRQATPGAGKEQAPGGKLRRVSFQFEATDPMCRVIRVTAPVDARPEEVAAELYGDPALAYLLLPARPLFGFRFPPSKRLAGAHHARWVEAARGAGVTLDRLSRNVSENDEPLDALVALSGLGGDHVDPDTVFMLQGTAAAPDASEMLARFESIATELTAVQDHAVTFGRGNALSETRLRIEARKAQCQADPSSCIRWAAQSRAQLQILRSVGRGLSVAAKFAEHQQGACTDEPTDISRSLHTPLVRVARQFIQVAAVSDLPDVARPRLIDAQQGLNAYPVEVMEETLRYVRSVVQSMAAGKSTYTDQHKHGPGAGRLGNAEATLRAKLLVVRENLLHNPVVGLAMLLEVENELRRLKFEARLGARMRTLEDLKQLLAPMRHRVTGLTEFIRMELEPLWKLWLDATTPDVKSGRNEYPLEEAEKRLDALAQRPQFATIVKQTLDFVQDDAAKDRIRAAAKMVGLTTLLSLGGPLAVGAGAAPEVGAASIAEGGFLRWSLSGARRDAGLANVGVNLTLQAMDHGSDFDSYNIPAAALDYVVGAMAQTLGTTLDSRWRVKWGKGGWKTAETWKNVGKQQAVWVPFAALVGTLRAAISQGPGRASGGAIEQWLEGVVDVARREALKSFLYSKRGQRWFPGGEDDRKFIYIKTAAKLIQKAATREAISYAGHAIDSE